MNVADLLLWLVVEVLVVYLILIPRIASVCWAKLEWCLLVAIFTAQR